MGILGSSKNRIHGKKGKSAENYFKKIIRTCKMIEHQNQHRGTSKNGNQRDPRDSIIRSGRSNREIDPGIIRRVFRAGLGDKEGGGVSGRVGPRSWLEEGGGRRREKGGGRRRREEEEKPFPASKNQKKYSRLYGLNVLDLRYVWRENRKPAFRRIPVQ
jgi:hypothetical protein